MLEEIEREHNNDNNPEEELWITELRRSRRSVLVWYVIVNQNVYSMHFVSLSNCPIITFLLLSFTHSCIIVLRIEHQ